MLYTLKKGKDKVVALFLSPPSDKGSATLRTGDNMWLFIPDVGRPMAAEEQKDAILLSLKAKTGEVAYDRLKMWVDKRALLPVTIEGYAASGLLIKTLRFSDIKDFGGGIKRPSTLETDSPLYKDYKSVMLWSGLEKAVFPDEYFTVNYLPRIPELRK